MSAVVAVLARQWVLLVLDRVVPTGAVVAFLSRPRSE
jgi:hypothetical protein